MNFWTQIQKEVLPLLKMTKIGIISGDGNLPLYIGKSLLSKNYDVTFLSLNNKNNKFYIYLIISFLINSTLSTVSVEE